MGHGAIAGALVIGLFWAVLARPERIRNHNEFRLAAFCLGTSFVLTVIVPVAIFASLDEGRPERREAFAPALYLLAFPAILTMLSLLLAIDSVMPRRAPRPGASDRAREQQPNEPR